MAFVPTVSFHDARDCVIDRVTNARRAPAVEEVELGCAAGRVLAGDARADRDYPAPARWVLEGSGGRAWAWPGTLRVTGEGRAGEVFAGSAHPGGAVEIMRGAPIPAGADAVVMVEHVTREGETVRVERGARAGQ